MNKSELKKVNWMNSTMSVGIEKIDDQHKNFLDITNNAIDAILSDNQSAVANTLKELKEYAHYHFKTEADLMAEHEYPESGSHHNAHIDFHDKVAELENAEGEAREAELVSFMQNWLVRHISSTDKKLANYINRQ
ncbi:MAG: hypothetical protein C0602_02420 [Denitrovibrio sp.]|nr:MAG: hypothetical protein C0602_02420 [Denitrovibrio sp.]